MTNVVPPRTPIELPENEAPATRSSAQRMQQRLEWERALLEAQPREEGSRRIEAPRDPDPPHTESKRDVMRDDARGRPDGPRPLPHGSRTRRLAATSEAGRAAHVSPRAATQPAGPPTTTAGPELSPARESRGGRTEAPLRQASPLPRPQPATREPVTMGFFRDDGALRVWMRDAAIGRETGTRIVQQLRQLLARLGLRLSSFTLNGARLVHEPESDASRGSDSERELDILY